MNETEMAVRFAEHEKEIGSLKHRVDDLEVESKTIQDLTISVNKLANNMEHMLRELNRQGQRLEAVERVPMETGKQIKSAVITALVGGAVGAVVTALLTII